MQPAGPTSHDSPPCLDPEGIAALIDGRLPAAERDDALRHAASCSRCYELLTETGVALMEDAGGTPARRPGWVLPVLAAAAGIVLVFSMLVFDRPRPVEVAALLEDLRDPAAAARHLRQPEVTRGAPAGVATGAVELGALLVDLGVAARAEDEARARPVLAALAARLQSVSHLGEEAAMCQTAAAAPADPARWRDIAILLDGRLGERLPGAGHELGKLLEAGRLAAATGSDGFFDRRRRKALERLAAAEGVAEAGGAVSVALQEWDARPRDLGRLERSLDQALRRARGE